MPCGNLDELTRKRARNDLGLLAGVGSRRGTAARAARRSPRRGRSHARRRAARHSLLALLARGAERLRAGARPGERRSPRGVGARAPAGHSAPLVDRAVARADLPLGDRPAATEDRARTATSIPTASSSTRTPAPRRARSSGSRATRRRGPGIARVSSWSEARGRPAMALVELPRAGEAATFDDDAAIAGRLAEAFVAARAFPGVCAIVDGLDRPRPRVLPAARDRRSPRSARAPSTAC